MGVKFLTFFSRGPISKNKKIKGALGAPFQKNFFRSKNILKKLDFFVKTFFSLGAGIKSYNTPDSQFSNAFFSLVRNFWNFFRPAAQKSTLQLSKMVLHLKIG